MNMVLCQNFKYVLIFAALVILLLAVSQYLRHRMDTKYRDLSIIALLLPLKIGGVLKHCR